MKRIDFENGTVTRNIFGAALPMLIAQILTLLITLWTASTLPGFRMWERQHLGP